MIDLTVNETVLKAAVAQAKARDFRIPTFKQMRDPSLIPDDVKRRLADVGLWDLDPINLYRITWHNEPDSYRRRLRWRELVRGSRRRSVVSPPGS